MVLNEIGAIAAAEWENPFALRPDMNLAMGYTPSCRIFSTRSSV
jgi:hypothetical protein